MHFGLIYQVGMLLITKEIGGRSHSINAFGIAFPIPSRLLSHFFVWLYRFLVIDDFVLLS